MIGPLTVDEAREQIDVRLREIDELWAAARKTAPAPRQALTPAVRAVARMAAWSHLSLPEIARERGVSVNTVKSQLRVVYGALGIHHRTELPQALRDAERIPAGVS